jgi:hypothetical protein
MKTQVFRIDLAAESDLAGAISRFCDRKLSEGLRLAASFAFENQLILIFQPA